MKCDVCEKREAKWECPFCEDETYFCNDCKQSHDWCMEYRDMIKLD